MELLVKIPKEFEQHFKQDAFEDSLHRLSADAHLLAGNYEQETAVMLIEAFASAVPVPPHGRLIDADALYKSYGASGNCNKCDLDAYKCQYYNEHTLMEFCELIDDAPTIIDAEEGE